MMSFQKFFVAVLGVFMILAEPLFAAPDFAVITDQMPVPLLNPALAQRQTAKIRLANGLEAYLVSDPAAEKSAAAMVVLAGSWEDPDSAPGMAHFTEHLLFLGTEKYPEESSFDRFIGQHGGTTNASTAVDQTTFVFSVNTDVFPQALDRFASFFREPLFNPSGVQREITAIDQEFARIARTDEGRTMLVLQTLNNPKHPNSRFTVGDKSTLTPVSRQQLIDWYRSHYSANLMRLVVYSSLDLETLKKAVVADFHQIPNLALERPHFIEFIYGKAMKGTMSYVESLKDARSVTLRWELPGDFAKMQDRHPDQVICFVLGHEGENSLLAQLKAEGYAEGLSCGGDRSGEDSFLTYLQIDLTKKGLKEVDQVIQRTFQAIDSLHSRGPVKYLFDEVQRRALLAYQYQERQDAYDYVSRLADAIGDEDFSTFPVKSFTVQKYDPKAIMSFLSYLTPQAVHITIRAPASYLEPDLTKVEKWTGTRYATHPIPRQELEKWRNLETHSNLNIPAPNPFMPRDLKLVATGKTAQPQPIVKAIVNDDRGHLYYALDQYYQVPQVYVYLDLLTPQINDGDAKKAVLLDLYVKALQEALKPILYPAEMAGLETQLGTKTNALGIEISGFSEHATRLLRDIIAKLKTTRPTAEQFAKYKESITQEYRNFVKEPPLSQAAETMSAILHRDYTTHQDKLHAIQRLTLQDLVDYASKLWDQSYAEGIFYGNLTEQQAKNMATIVREGLGGRPYPVKEHRSTEIADLTAQDQASYVVHKAKTSGNALVLAIQNTPYSATLHGAQDILSQGMSAPFFNALRTQQQTGYVVTNWDQEMERHLFLFFAVESDTHDSRDLLARFELFFEDFLRQLGTTELSESEFINIRDSLVRKLEKPAQNLKDMGQILGALATDYDGDFDWINKRITAMKALSYVDFLTLSRQMLVPQNSKRLAVLFRGTTSGAHKLLEYTAAKNVKDLRSQLDYQPRVHLSTGRIEKKSSKAVPVDARSQ